MHIKKTKFLSAFLLAAVGILGVKVGFSYAGSNTNFNQSINGNLGIGIVDSSGNNVTSPSVSFSSLVFSMNSQTSTGTLGASSEKIRVTNPTSTPTWTASIAATSGPTALWQGSDKNYDFNGSAAAGQMTINPTAGTITGAGSTSIANVSLGASNSFAQGTKDSIDLMSAAIGAQAPGQWDLTNVGISQTVPAGQAAQSYSIQMTVTIS